MLADSEEGTHGQAASEIFKITARRCKRCGGLLTSAQAIKDGYGNCCLRKVQQEEQAKEQLKNQCSLFDDEKIRIGDK